MSDHPAHASPASAGPSVERRRADRRDRDRSEVVAVGHESGDDPWVQALVQEDERDSTPPGTAELSQENLAHLLERLDGPLKGPGTMDSATRASVDRAFGAPASGQFPIAQPSDSRFTNHAADDHGSGTPRPTLRSGTVRRRRRRARPVLAALLWSLLAVALGALAASWEWTHQPPPAGNMFPTPPASSRGSLTPIVEPLTATATPVPPEDADLQGPVAGDPAPEGKEDPAAEGKKTGAETPRPPASARPRSRREHRRARATRRPHARGTREATLKVTRAAGPARIFLGKRLLGKVPGEVTLPPGRHHLMIRTPDGVSYMRTVRARPGAEMQLALP